VKDTVIAAEEVKARWAYCEITSERFGGTYRTTLPGSVWAAAVSGAPFSQVPASEWPRLIAALKIARNSEFIDCIDRFGAPRYLCVEWEVPRLLSCLTLPCFGQAQYFRFLALPPRQDAVGNPDNNDPRLRSDVIPFNTTLALKEPLIAILANGAPMLLEGYLRSILWLRNPVHPLPVWVPVAR